MPRRRAAHIRRRTVHYARAGLAVSGLFALLIAVVGVTAANSVAASRVDDRQDLQGAQDVAPNECEGLGLTAIVNGSSGTAANELVLGTSSINVIDGRDGNDCILGGGGADDIEGGNGYDICIGGGGTDVLGISCEVRIQ